MFDKDAFLKVYGDLHIFIGMLLHKAHGDNQEMFEIATKAAATIMAEIAWTVDPNMTEKEVSKVFQSRKDMVNEWEKSTNISDEVGEA